MSEYDGLDIDLKQMSNDQLIEFKKKLDEIYEDICDRQAKELSVVGEDFDPFSRKGEKFVNKIIKKYNEKEDGCSFLMEAVIDEMKSRNLEIDEEFAGQSSDEDLSDDDYILREIKRSDINKTNKNTY